MALLHVQTNFLEREFRFDGYFQQNLGGDKTRSIGFFDALVAYSFNRRFMLEVVSNNEWLNPSKGDEEFGAAAALVARLQLIDVPGSSYAFNFRVTTANPDIGISQTIFSPSLAGWQDLTCIGLKRVGLYYSIQYEGYEGAAKAGSKHNDIVYAASLARTWTSRDTRFIGNFTTFCEVYGTTALDGSARGSSAINVTPGIRFNITRTNVIMAGVDLPVSNPHDFDATYRLTYIINF
jgi:hypothetical protein